MKKIISVMIVFSLVITTFLPVTVFAQNAEQDIATVSISDDTEIVSSYDNQGNLILSEYINGVLTQRNTIYTDDSTDIKREHFEGAYYTDTLDATDVVSVIEEPSSSPAPYATSSTKTGYIYFNALTAYDTISYSVKCVCTSTYIGNTTHKITNYKGKVVDLVSSIIDVFSLVTIIAAPSILTEFITAVCESKGVAIVLGILQAFLTTTVACQKTAYSWTLSNPAVSGDYHYQSGAQYRVIDDTVNVSSEYFYTGYVPQDWKDDSLAVGFHNAVYNYDQWSVVRWSSLT